MNQSTELAGLIEACPFCSGSAKHQERHNPMSKWRHSIDCETCGMSGPVEATRAQAITAWNNRPAPALTEAPEPLVERKVGEAIRDELSEHCDWSPREIDWQAVGRAALSSITTTELSSPGLSGAVPSARSQVASALAGRVGTSAATTEDSAEVVQATEAHALALENWWANYPLSKADAANFCRSPELCFEYNEWVRCGPCGIKLRDQRIASQPSVEREALCARHLDTLTTWLLHRFGPDSPEGREASFRQTIARTALATPVVGHQGDGAA